MDLKGNDGEIAGLHLVADLAMYYKSATPAILGFCGRFYLSDTMARPSFQPMSAHCCRVAALSADTGFCLASADESATQT